MKFYLNCKEISEEQLKNKMEEINNANVEAQEEFMKDYLFNNSWTCHTISLSHIDSESVRFTTESYECFW